MTKQKIWGLVGFFLLVSLQSLQAQLTTSGLETLANATTLSTQKNPAVAMSPTGEYVVVWESLGQDGDGYGIYAQVYTAAGAVSVSEFLVNTTTAADQRKPDVAMDGSGNFIITWQSYTPTGANGWDIFYRTYNLAGIATTGQIRANNSRPGNQRHPKVSARQSGNFVITWEDDGDVYAEIYEVSGATIVTDFLVNTTTANEQIYPAVAMNFINGDFIIAWQSLNQDGDGYGIYSRIYQATGSPITGELICNTTTAGNQIEPSVTFDDSGEYLVGWSSFGTDGDNYGIYIQFFDAAGITIGSEFQVNSTTTSTQHHVEVTKTANNFYLVAWTGYDQDGDAAGVYTAVIDNTPSIIVAETQVNSNTTDYQQFPSVATDNTSAGDAIIIWQDGLHELPSVNEGAGYGIYFQTYNTNFPFPITLLDFDAIRQDQDYIALTWITASELQNRGFDIEMSFDKQNFETIGFVEGAGTTQETQTYTWTYPNRKAAYYRLRQVDFDGAFTFSPIRFVNGVGDEFVWNIYPNPTQDAVVIDMGQTTSDVLLRVWSVNGKELIHLRGELVTINQQLNAALAQWPLGIYQIQIQSDNRSLTQKLLKQ
ncbi:MAG: T9SS type A sorting domain-containing protein [Bacteroidota bacterium]